MEYEIVDKDEVLRKIRMMGVKENTAIVVRMYLTSRDPQYSKEMQYCIHECLDDLKFFDNQIIAVYNQIPIDDDVRKEYDFDIIPVYN